MDCEGGNEIELGELEKMGTALGIQFLEASREMILEVIERDTAPQSITKPKGSERKRLAVKDLRKHKKPDVLVIIESKTKGVTEQLINDIWERTNRQWVAKEVVGTPGGIIIIWRVDIMSMMEVETEWYTGEGPKTSMAGTEEYSLSDWGPWIIGGDFNTIQCPEEKTPIGRINTSMRKLSDFILDYELLDLPLEGDKYKWTNSQDRLVLGRLDRILLSKEWEELFPRISQRALSRPISDHNPIMLELSEYTSGPRPFRFDMDLCELPDFEDLIKGWWNELNTSGWYGFVFGIKHKHLKVRIRNWAKVARET
ncbi:uncharacterized protein LOC143859460 [Tasmannia lanceolata]|uniref:uncharacterized protein LOC143859460 n=1 Tax=Tasmannia lanceolata TaxID=3420 RepID=UPI0040645D0D